MAGVLVVSAVSAAGRTRGHGPVICLRHLGVMLVPVMGCHAGRCRGCGALMVVMVFHVLT
jgi:hypothetical protein